MKFLADENVRRSVVSLLQQMGHDAIHIIDIQAAVNDETVLAWAFQKKRILITNDTDFSALAFYYKLPTYGIILLRLQNESREIIHARLRNTIEQYGQKLKGHFILITDTQVRIRPLVDTG